MSKASHPDARAIGVFARSILRELHRAQYARQDVLLLVNALLEATASEFSADAPSWRGRIHDPETDLLADATLRDALSFALRAASDAGALPVLVVLAVETSGACADDVSDAVHAALAAKLRTGLRGGDVAGRLSSSSYAVALQGVTEEGAREIVRRLLLPLFEGTAGAKRHASVRVISRLAAARPADDVDAWLARAREQEPHAHAPAASPRDPGTRTPRLPRSEGVVLALGGGAARAAAHVGVLDVLEQERVPIHGVAGTGGGALVGAMYLAGKAPTAIMESFADFGRSAVYSQIRREYASFLRETRAVGSSASSRRLRDERAALYASDRPAALADRHFDALFDFFVGEDREIASLSAPFCATAVDLVSGRAVQLAHGSLYAALRAACALPGLFPPFVDGDRELVDGSPIVELPVAAAERLASGHHEVVAVYLARPPLPARKLKTGAETFARINAIVHTELLREQLRRAHHHLTVHVEPFGWLDFKRAKQAANLGSIATRDWLLALPPRG